MRKFKLKISKNIKEDIKNLSDHMSARKKLQLIEELNYKFKNIIKMPQMYQRLYYEEKTKTDYRRSVCKNYIITYKIYKNQITILRIVSEKENYLKSGFFETLLKSN